MRKNWFLVMVAFVVISAFACHAVAQPAAPAGRAGQQNAEALLKQMADFLGKQPAYSCKLETVFELTHKDPPPGRPAEMKETTVATFRLARPNRMALVIDQGVAGFTIVSDGKQLTQYLPVRRRYVVSDAPARLAEMFDFGAQMPLTMLGGSDGTVPLGGEEFLKSLLEGVVKSEVVGQEKVGDVLCNRLRFIQEDYDWDIWIEAGARPVIHKIVPDLSKQVAQSQGQIEKVSYVVTMSDWNLAPKFADADFKFTPPKGAKQGESLFQSEEPPHPLLGQRAPEFTTTDVDGKEIDLKKQLGKNVILLDFWATWCGPCIQAMPQVEEVAKKYKDKGLVLYAVNVGENAETIKQFLQESKLNPPVAMNQDNKISEQYGVNGIPQTVLIGKDGTVQVVHVGSAPTLGKILSKEVEALLAGKDLAKATIARAKEEQQEQAAPPENPQPQDGPGSK